MLLEEQFIQHENSEDLLRAWEGIGKKDDVLGEILSAIQSKWKETPEKERLQIMKLTREIIKLGKHYNAAYQTLERISSPEIQMHFRDHQKGIGAIERADSGRRAAHNAAIDSLNILSRYMRQVGMDNSWRANSEIFADNSQTMRTNCTLDFCLAQKRHIR